MTSQRIRQIAESLATDVLSIPDGDEETIAIDSDLLIAAWINWYAELTKCQLKAEVKKIIREKNETREIQS